MKIVLKGLAIGTVVKVIIGVIVIVVALYFFSGMQNLFLPGTCEQSDLGIALSSVEALRCAVDLTAEQSPSVTSCNEGGKIKSLSAKLEGKEELQASGCKKVSISDTSAKFSCQNEKSCVSKEVECSRQKCETVFIPIEECPVEDLKVLPGGATSCGKTKEVCQQTNEWTCKVKEFELPQKIPVVTQLLTPVPDFIKNLIGSVGTPRFLVYYETFPRGYEQIWHYTPVDAIYVSAAVGGVANIGVGLGKTLGVGFKGLIGEAGQVVKKLFVSEIKSSTSEGIIASMKRAFVREFGGESILKLWLAKRAVRSANLLTGVVRETIGDGLTKEIRKLPLNTRGELSRILGKEVGDLTPEELKAVELVETKFSQKLGSYLKPRKVGTEIKVWVIPDEKTEKLIFDNAAEFESYVGQLDEQTFKNLYKESLDEASQQYNFLKLMDIDKINIRYFRSEFYDTFLPSYSSIIQSKFDESVTQKLLTEMVENNKALRKLVLEEKDSFIRKLLEIKKSDPKTFETIVSQIDKEISDSMSMSYNYFANTMLLSEKAPQGFVEKLGNNLYDVWSEDALKQYGERGTLILDRAKILASRESEFVKGRLGLPANFLPGKKRIIFYTAMATSVIANIILDPVEDIASTCGGNSLCLYSNSFLNLGEKPYSVKLSKDNRIFVFSKVPTLSGATPLIGMVWPDNYYRGVIVSPCKADIKVESQDKKCTVIPEDYILFEAKESVYECASTIPVIDQPGLGEYYTIPTSDGLKSISVDVRGFLYREINLENYREGGEIKYPNTLEELKGDDKTICKLIKSETERLGNLELKKLEQTTGTTQSLYIGVKLKNLEIFDNRGEKFTDALSEIFPNIKKENLKNKLLIRIEDRLKLYNKIKHITILISEFRGSLDTNLVFTFKKNACGQKSYVDCSREKFEEYLQGKNIKTFLVKGAISTEIQNINYDIRDKEKEVSISECTNYGKDQIKPLDGISELDKSVVISVDKADKDYSNNYCIQNKAKFSNMVSATCEAGSIAGSIVIAVATGGVGSAVGQFILGSGGAVCVGILEQADKWPSPQYS